MLIGEPEINFHTISSVQKEASLVLYRPIFNLVSRNLRNFVFFVGFATLATGAYYIFKILGEKRSTSGAMYFLYIKYIH